MPVSPSHPRPTGRGWWPTHHCWLSRDCGCIRPWASRKNKTTSMASGTLDTKQVSDLPSENTHTHKTKTQGLKCFHLHNYSNRAIVIHTLNIKELKLEARHVEGQRTNLSVARPQGANHHQQHQQQHHATVDATTSRASTTRCNRTSSCMQLRQSTHLPANKTCNSRNT